MLKYKLLTKGRDSYGDYMLQYSSDHTLASPLLGMNPKGSGLNALLYVIWREKNSKSITETAPGHNSLYGAAQASSRNGQMQLPGVHHGGPHLSKKAKAGVIMTPSK